MNVLSVSNFCSRFSDFIRDFKQRRFWATHVTRKWSISPLIRLQNSPYFCVFKYARAVKQKVWNEAENRERDWGETLKRRVRLACFARVRHLRHALPISLLNLRKKPTVLQSMLQYSFNVSQATNKYFFPDLDYYDILKNQNEWDL